MTRRGSMAGATRRRLATAVAASSLLAATIILLGTAGPSAARSSVPAARTPTTPVARVVPAPRPIVPHKGKPFIPVLGDWEGTVNGRAASFQLTYDASFRRRSGLPSYGISQVIGILPASCPPTAARYSESLIKGSNPKLVGRYGALGLSQFGFGGSFTARRAATLSRPFTVGSCHGKAIWKMHPANRLPVEAGGWKVRFAHGQTASFDVLAGGRLAAGFPLPHVLKTCSGTTGAVDLFVGPSGKASIAGPLVRLSMRFSRRTASGQLNAGGAGCAGGPIRFSAVAKTS